MNGTVVPFPKGSLTQIKHETLHSIHQEKVDAADIAILKLPLFSHLKKALQAKSTIKWYGTYGYLQLLDSEPFEGMKYQIDPGGNDTGYPVG